MATAFYSFSKLGIRPWQVKLCEQIGFENPTEIQQKTIPEIVKGKNIIANAETGSGKTAAFAFPILSKLSEDPFGIFALIITPNRELAMQINEQLKLFGRTINLRSMCITGGQDIIRQRMGLDDLPHIIVGTPGRLFQQIEESEVFQKYLGNLNFLVLDEADRLLEPTLRYFIDKIVDYLPKERQTIFTTATIDDTLLNLENALPLISHKPEQTTVIRTSEYTKIVQTLEQKYVYMPNMMKDYYFIYFLREFANISTIVFVNTCKKCHTMSFIQNNLGIKNVSLHSFLTQKKRQIHLSMFRNEHAKVMICTDVASRGLDIRTVDIVINLDIPRDYKDYVHRIGRAARGNKRGMSVSFITENDVSLIKNIESKTQSKMVLYKIREDDVMENVSEIEKAKRTVELKMFEGGDDEMFKKKTAMKSQFRDMILQKKAPEEQPKKDKKLKKKLKTK